MRAARDVGVESVKLTKIAAERQQQLEQQAGAIERRVSTRCGLLACVGGGGERGGGVRFSVIESYWIFPGQSSGRKLRV